MTAGPGLRSLQVVTDLHPRQGGPPRVAVGLACALARAGMQPEIATLCEPGEEEDVRTSWPDLVEYQVPLHLFERNRPFVAGYSRAFNRFMRNKIAQVDVLHVHGIWTHCLAYAARVARNGAVPYLVAPHGSLDHYSRGISRGKKAVSMAFGTRAMLKEAAAIQYGTEEEAQEAEELGFASPVLLAPNGVDLDKHQRHRGVGIEPLLKEYPGLGAGGPVFLFFSRLHPKKGLDILLTAFSRSTLKHPEARLLAAAIPEDLTLERELRARAAEAPLQGRAFITTDYIGKRGAIPINAADVFVHPSHQEGFSMAIIEAMASGMPVLITDRCHLPEIEEQGAGLVVPATVEGLANGMTRILQLSPDELRAMGNCGQEFVASRYTWDRVAARISAEYLRAAGGTPHAL